MPNASSALAAFCGHEFHDAIQQEQEWNVSWVWLQFVIYTVHSWQQELIYTLKANQKNHPLGSAGAILPVPNGWQNKFHPTEMFKKGNRNDFILLLKTQSCWILKDLSNSNTFLK